jgi:superfamily II DNA helicase RecQ
MKTASQRFGISELKEQQKKAVEATLCGKDVFVSLPTGFGKSLIYQLLPVCAEALAILSPVGPDFKPFIVIVSPLISLMQDQVATLRDKGFKASLCVSHRECA